MISQCVGGSSGYQTNSPVIRIFGLSGETAAAMSRPQHAMALMESPADDLHKTADQLIADMQGLIVRGGSPTNPGFNTRTALEALRKFACVLTVLSGEADKQTKRVVKLTWGLFWLTVLLGIIAAGQIAIAVADLVFR